ncbi:MAG: response regulator transcription factor [Lactobacillus sp.]|jgi:DNA-binding NarL/FixJ family response regulator|nr:response regulator transcription factor [Lactobacillus sp.]
MKVLIADDHALFRDGLTMRLKQIDSDINVLSAENFKGALRILDKETDFDLIILDLDMPDMGWEEAFDLVKEKAGKSRIAILSASENNRDIKKAMEKGAAGYITKRSDPKILTSALNLMLDGSVYLPPEILDKSKAPQHTPYAVKENKLTQRQAEVLKLIAEGKSNKQIAFELNVSEATVKLHINALLRALKATNRTQAVIIAQKEGII